MASSPEDRATREIEELRQLFAKPVRRQTPEPDQAANAKHADTTTHGQADTTTHGQADTTTHGQAKEMGEDVTTGAGQAADVAAPAADPEDQGPPDGQPEPPKGQIPRRVTGSVSSRTLVSKDEPETADPRLDEAVGEPAEPEVIAAPVERLVPVEPSLSPALDEPRPGRHPWRIIGLAAVLLAVAFVFGIWLGQGLSDDGQTTAQSPETPASTQPVQVVTTASAPPAAIREACLETARLADQVIDLLVANKRGRELDPLLRAYGTASQRCRATVDAGQPP
jgi:hypothetical protein